MTNFARPIGPLSRELLTKLHCGVSDELLFDTTYFYAAAQGPLRDMCLLLDRGLEESL